MRIRIIAVLAPIMLVLGCTTPRETIAIVAPQPANGAGAQPSLAALSSQAQNGDDAAAMRLADVYYRAGRAVDAVKWMKLAAERGSAAGQAGMGRAYTLGIGVPQDYSLALKYNQLAVDQNGAAGLNNLAFQYSHGFGVPVDPDKASKLFRRSAMQGDVFAQSALGNLYAEGTGVPKNSHLAYFWNSLAATGLTSTSLEVVAKRRDAIAATLPPGVLASLQTAATNWTPGTEPPQ